MKWFADVFNAIFRLGSLGLAENNYPQKEFYGIIVNSLEIFLNQVYEYWRRFDYFFRLFIFLNTRNWLRWIDVFLWTWKYPTTTLHQQNRTSRRLPGAHVWSLHQFKFKWMVMNENCVRTFVIILFGNYTLSTRFCAIIRYLRLALIDTFSLTGYHQPAATETFANK